MKEEIKVSNLVRKFEDMADRGTLLVGSQITQQDLLIQILGTIYKVATEEDGNK